MARGSYGSVGGLARRVLNKFTKHPYKSNRLFFSETPMDIFALPDPPPTDLVTFLAQRIGVSPEAAELRLECWFGEYHATSGQRLKATSKREHTA